MSIKFDGYGASATSHFVVDGIHCEGLATAIEIELGIDAPCNKSYTYRYRNPSDDCPTTGTLRGFRLVVEVAYYHPWKFTCTNLSKEEQDYVDLVLELRTKERLTGD